MSTDPRAGWLRELAAILLLWGLVAVAFAGHNYLTFAANGRPMPLAATLWWSVAEWLPWVVLTPLVLRAVRATRPGRAPLLRTAVALAIAGIAFAIAHVLLEYALDRLVVLVTRDPDMTVRVWLADGQRGAALELAYLIPRKVGFAYVTYWAVVVTAMAIEYHRLFVERDVRAARLEGALLGAQLQALHAQLQPHFLFNTLNSIASLIPENPAAAEETVESLSELLRASLNDAGRREIPLLRELELLELYVGIQETRFQGRLRVRRSIDPALAQALVPPMLLQPLVENAIRHGIAVQGRGGVLEIRTRAVGRDLELMVEDDGPGFSSTLASRDAVAGARESGLDSREAGDGTRVKGRERIAGVGLANTRARLERLYGGHASLEVGNRPEGGAFARIRLPLAFERNVVPDVERLVRAGVAS